MRLKKIPPMAMVIFAVCMVSYSGPMIKGALNEGASPASVAFLRMLAAALLLFFANIGSSFAKTALSCS